VELLLLVIGWTVGKLEITVKNLRMVRVGAFPSRLDFLSVASKGIEAPAPDGRSAAVR
jgi:hypothetical protein